ncbi:MAG: alpha-ketoacid dehydrogenase subunit beta, partial [Pseudomonadota bacterium]|nr:alpha-ketoacid dehydrogenase subunit beta [Pseudomonadota bacterium]
LAGERIEAEVVDLRVINPIDHAAAAASVQKTGRLCAIDGSWSNCGLAAEIIAGVCERVPPSQFKSAPLRITLPDAPAPGSGALEAIYYPTPERIAERVRAAIR